MLVSHLRLFWSYLSLLGISKLFMQSYVGFIVLLSINFMATLIRQSRFPDNTLKLCVVEGDSIDSRVSLLKTIPEYRVASQKPWYFRHIYCQF